MRKFYFSPYSKPSAPSPPPKKITEYEAIETRKGNYSTHPIPAGADHVSVETESGYDGDTEVTITFSKAKEIDNPHYERYYKQYEEDKLQYKEDIKEWKRLKEEWDKEQREGRRRLYEQLKEEFGGNDRNTYEQLKKEFEGEALSN